MHPDELAEKVERELRNINPTAKPEETERPEISSAVESVAIGINPVMYRDSYFDPESFRYLTEQGYLDRFRADSEDMSFRVPLKWLNILPKSQMGGILGFTYLGDHSMGRRDDLTGGMARMVDIHESIHTPDEYETRVLTDWVMEGPKMKYL